MPAYNLPATVDPSKVTFKVFSYAANGVPPEEFVVNLSQISNSIGATIPVDDTYRGSVITRFNAGATIAQWEAVYLNSSSLWLLADANGSSTFPARGLAIAAGTNGNPLTILREGEVRNDAWNWTIGGNIYLSETPGALTQTAPTTSSNVQAVGWATSADTAFFTFNSTFRPVP